MIPYRSGFALALFVLPLSTSFSASLGPGLLTDDYGIVTLEDVKRELAVFQLPDFPQISSVFPYWRCLRPEQVMMECKDIDSKDSAGESVFSPILSIATRWERFDYYTPRPSDREICEETIGTWKAILSSEAVVCISADVDGEINRMKNHSGQWSYFIEEGESLF